MARDYTSNRPHHGAGNHQHDSLFMAQFHKNTDFFKNLVSIKKAVSKTCKPPSLC
jgi:hypothetical protein